MVIFWPDFYADHDGTNGFWKIFDFAKNNPVYKFDTLWGNNSVYVHDYGPKFGLMNSFLTLIMMNKQKDSYGFFFLTCTPLRFLFFLTNQEVEKTMLLSEKIFRSIFFDVNPIYRPKKIFFQTPKSTPENWFIAFLFNNLTWLYLYIVLQRHEEDIDSKVWNFRNI